MHAKVVRTWCLLLVACPLVALADTESFRKFLDGSRDQFKEVELRRANPPFAAIHELGPPGKPLEYEGRFYTGFRFSPPDWLDGGLIWMFALRGPEANWDKAGYKWSLVAEEESPAKIKIEGTRFRNNVYPKFRELFPDSESFTIQFIFQEGLVPGKRYFMAFSFPTREIPRIRFAMTVRSPRGVTDLGMLPTGFPALGPGPAFRTITDREPKPPQKIRNAAAASFKTSGCEPALRLLDGELDDFIHCGGKFHDLFLALWRDAQTGTGHDHPEWEAALFEWLQQQCIKLQAVTLAEDLVGNTFGALLNVNRVGAARRALQPLEIGMGRRQVDLDPKSYEDAGPALTSLPEVRLRSTPSVGKRWMATSGYDGWVNLNNNMQNGFADAMLSMAQLEFLGGDWQRALERQFWADDWLTRNLDKAFEAKARWFTIRLQIAATLKELGLLEAADAEYRVVLDKDWEDPYGGRSQIFAKHERIAIRISLGGAEEGMLEELASLRETIDKNRSVSRFRRESLDVTRARCLAALGRFEEADSLLGKLVDGGNREARLQRLRLRLDGGKVSGLEDELLRVLAESREAGRKIEEPELYSLYADLLEAAGRLNEALAMRQEALRLARGFDLFTRTPVELAKLSVLLAKCRNEAAAKIAAAEASRLAAHSQRIPPRIAQTVAAVLATAPAKPPVATPAGPAPLADLQPVRAVVAPIAGRPLRGQLTLANPSAVVVEGALTFSGPPVAATWDAASQVVLAVIGGAAGSNRIAPLRVGAGTFARIVLEGRPGYAASGELVVSWKAPGQAEQRSLWTLDPPEQEVFAAVIEAGEFKRNPFHAVPIFHHYQHAVEGTRYAPIRVVASAPARVEMFDAADQPVSVDAIGNGSLVDAGDTVFSDPDFDGVADLPLEHGEATLRVQVFPPARLPHDGLQITIEALINGAWTPVAHDRIIP